jgi:thioredoxin 1
MSNNVHNSTDETFESDVLKADLPVLVDFWAEWCAPCRAIAPVVEELAREYAGRVKFVKVNVDRSSETPAKYNVRGIPTLILVKNGDVKATKVGSLSKTQLSAFIDENI